MGSSGKGVIRDGMATVGHAAASVKEAARKNGQTGQNGSLVRAGADFG